MPGTEPSLLASDIVTIQNENSFHSSQIDQPVSNTVVSNSDSVSTQVVYTLNGSISCSIQFSSETSHRQNVSVPDSREYSTYRPLSAPLFSQAAPSSQESTSNTIVTSQAKKTRTNAPKKSKADTEEIELKFVKRELAAAQARIVQLDADINDRNKRIKILMDSIKSYEENETARSFRNYFPQSQGLHPNHDTHAHACVNACSVNHHNLICCHSSCSSNNHPCTCSSSKRQTPSNETTTLVLGEVNNSMSSLKHCMEEIKLSLDKLSSVIEIKFLGSSNTQATMHPNSDLTQNMDEDSISVASVESFIPDEPQINLN